MKTTPIYTMTRTYRVTTEPHGEPEMSFEIHRNDGITVFVNDIVCLINRQFQNHNIAAVCAIVPARVDDPKKPTEPEWRNPIAGIDEGNLTAEFRDSLNEKWEGKRGSWRGVLAIDNGRWVHISGKNADPWNYARVKDDGPHIAPKSAN